MSVLPTDDSVKPMQTEKKKKDKKEKKEGKDGSESVAGKKRKRSEVEAEAAPAAVDEEIPLPPEEAPLSHKQLRKVKKKAAKGDTPAISGDGKTEKPAKSESGEKPVRQNSVWVGNLAFKTSESDIKTFFAECGTVTRIHMPRKTGAGPGGGMRGQNMGFAYVDFDTPEARDAAIKLSESPLHGRKLLIKDGNDYRGRPTAAQKTAAAEEGEDGGATKPALTKTAQKILKSQKHPPGPTLFMGNLGFETTQETIKEMLEGHHKTAHAVKKRREEDEDADMDGDAAKEKDKDIPELGLRKIRLGTFEDTGVCKGWAFLDFHTTAQAQAVLINARNHNLNGRKLVLEFASADAVRRGGHPSAFAGKEQKEGGEGKKVKKFGGGKSAGYDKKNKRRREHAEAGDGAEGGEQEDVPAAFPSAPANETEERPAKRQKGGRERPQSDNPRMAKDRPAKRLKPGAALALAVQSTTKTGAIVASEGKKITFS